MSHRRRYAPLVVLAALASQPAWGAADGKALELRRTAAELRVDAQIEPAWAAADSVDDYVQFGPYNGQTPSRRTVTRVLTTDEALYCLMVCQDDPRQVQAQTGILDESAGETVSLMLDTFGDARTAYKFVVSAGGSRSDCRLLDDARNRDYAWDGVWFAATRLTAEGYVVEMRIPYRTLQYDPALTAWGLDFDRWRPGDGEDIYWCAYASNEGQRISKFGRLLLGDFHPAAPGLGVELYPVALGRAVRTGPGDHDLEGEAGLDVLYNPSEQLTLQLTANPDFAQVEADPFEFNITRYETWYEERRPFFTQGSEVFMASGGERNSSFYQPLELFYSRRIGQRLPGGGEVPLRLGGRAFGRAGAWEYGGFLAGTGDAAYPAEAGRAREPEALYSAARIKRTVLGNSTIGLLCAAKGGGREDNGVLDLDGALRGPDWQLAYQVARSWRERADGGTAASAGFKLTRERLTLAAKGRAIGSDFDVDGVGFVPWRGLSDLTILGGPRWYFPNGRFSEIEVYAGGNVTHEQVDAYTDRALLVGMSVSARPMAGGELTLQHGRSRDAGTRYTATQLDGNAYTMGGSWRVQLYGSAARTYNFLRGYRGLYSWAGTSVDWQPWDTVQLGTSADVFVEADPDGRVDEVTWNARPQLTLTPVNDLRLYLYVDNLLLRSTGALERVMGGLLFSWQFQPKSWLYLAVNEVQERAAPGAIAPRPLRVIERAGVLKAKLLYYL